MGNIVPFVRQRQPVEVKCEHVNIVPFTFDQMTVAEKTEGNPAPSIKYVLQAWSFFCRDCRKEIGFDEI